MKAREAALRLKRFEVGEKTKKVMVLESMIRDFQSMASDLDRQIQVEEDRTGVRDVAHFSYSTFAKSAAQRRDNLRASAAELMAKLEAAMKDRDDAAGELAQADTPDPLEELRSRRRGDRSASAGMR
jgi:flagellar protein FliJ